MPLPLSQLLLPMPDTHEPLEILGEMDDWLTPKPVPPGKILQRSLPPGVYAYKLRHGKHWLLDPNNPRTRHTNGSINNVAVVGGTPEPILFAPAPPFLVADSQGKLLVRAALRKGYGNGLLLRWCDTTSDTTSDTIPGTHRSPMLPVSEEPEHLLFETQLSLSGTPLSLTFELIDGTTVGCEPTQDPFLILPEQLQQQLPAWWSDAVVYTIFVDRFRASSGTGDLPDPGRNRAAGGTLDGIRAALPTLRELGVNTLYLTPIHLAANCHRYDLVNPMRVDPSLGGESAFQQLIDEAHQQLVRILLDFSFSHVGRGFPPFEHVLENGPSSPFANWFLWTSDPTPSLRHYGRRTDAPLLNLDHPEVRQLVIDTARYWAHFGIDGFRLDAAAEVPHDLARMVRKALCNAHPNRLVLGEVVPSHAWRWHVEQSVDVSTDFGFHEAVLEFVATRSIDAERFRSHLEQVERTRGVSMEATARFLSTHDHNRFATFARMQGDVGRHSLGLLLLISMPGTPMLLYGEELGLSSPIAEIDPESVWFDRMPMRWDHVRGEEAIRDLTRDLLRVRREHAALRKGTLLFAHAEGPLLVFRRQARGGVIDGAVNASDLPIELDLEDDELDQIHPLIVVGEVRVQGTAIILGPNAGLLARRSASPRAKAMLHSRIHANEARVRRSLALPETPIPCRPTRLDITVTERCNLRCLHCINHSPERTRSRQARSLSPFLVERLRDDLTYASYFGFVHGGESLTAPIFWDLLIAIQEQRCGIPTTIHLLSNGMMLTESVFRRLITLGVNSLSVSIDGTTAATNDRIRLGSSLGKIESNLRAAIAIRKEESSDIRLGLSWVVCRENLEELSEFVEMAVDWGVDWIKLEELVDVNDASRDWMVDITLGKAREAVLHALKRSRELGLVAVDHTFERQVWRCRLDEETQEFLEADSFANRSSIHPCRSLWERACIDPNGDVRLGDVHGSVLGNLAYDTLLDLWQSKQASAERQRLRAGWLCAPGPITCT